MDTVSTMVYKNLEMHSKDSGMVSLMNGCDGKQGRPDLGRTGGTTRKPRIIIIDDDPFILGLLADFFSQKDYEVQSFAEPVLCTPANVTKGCLHACADIIITDLRMPRITGIQLLRHQNNGGCAIDINNKAVFSANLDELSGDDISTLAGSFFEKPCTLQELYAWTQKCVSRVDLSHPLGDYSVKEQ